MADAAAGDDDDDGEDEGAARRVREVRGLMLHGRRAVLEWLLDRTRVSGPATAQAQLAAHGTGVGAVKGAADLRFRSYVDACYVQVLPAHLIHRIRAGS